MQPTAARDTDGLSRQDFTCSRDITLAEGRRVKAESSATLFGRIFGNRAGSSSSCAVSPAIGPRVGDNAGSLKPGDVERAAIRECHERLTGPSQLLGRLVFPTPAIAMKDALYTALVCAHPAPATRMPSG